MVYYLIAIGFVVLAAGTAWAWRARSTRHGPDPNAGWRPVDVASLKTLLDPGEMEFLRDQLTPEEFRRHHRRRMRVAWRYLGRLAHNARLVVHAGQLIQAMSEATNVQAQQVVNQAVQVRTEILRMQFRVAAWYALPGLRPDVLPALQHYFELEQVSTPLVRPVESTANWVH